MGRHVYAGVESLTSFEGDLGGAFGGPPVFVSTEVTTVDERETYSYDADAIVYDPNDVVTYRRVAGPTGMTVDTNTGQVALVTTSADLGAHDVILRAEDLAGNFVDQIFVLTVTNVNDPPDITSTPVTSATEGQPYVYDVTATDPDPGDILAHSLDTSPQGMTIDGPSGLVSWTPAPGQSGLHTVVVRVTDLGGLFDTQTYEIDVASGNQPPTIVSTPVLSVSADTNYAYQVEATDPDVGDVLTHTLTESPSGMTIEAANGLVTCGWEDFDRRFQADGDP